MAFAGVQILAQIDSWQMLAVITKTLTYGTSFFASGGLLFTLLFKNQLNVDEQALIRFAIRWSAACALVLSLMRIVVISGMLGGEWSSMFNTDLIRIVLESKEGLATGLRVGGLLLLLISLQIGTSIAASTTGLFAAFLTATSFAWLGHVGEMQEFIVPRLLIAIHLLAVAYWLGALWPLYRLAGCNEPPRIAGIMRRFGQIAVLVIGLLLLAGIILLYWLLGSFNPLWNSAYGQMFVIKLLSVGVLLGFAAQNKFRFVPAIHQGKREGLAKLRRSIQVEMALAVLILLVTATFTTVSGPIELK